MRMDLPIQVNVRPSKTSNLIQKEREWMTKPYQPRTFLNLQVQIMKLSSTSHDQRAGRSMVGCDSIQLIIPGFNIILLPSKQAAASLVAIKLCISHMIEYYCYVENGNIPN